MRLTASEVMSAEKDESRKTVKPSLRVSWNQSRRDTIAIQLWKYSCATTPAPAQSRRSPPGLASTHDVLKTLRPLFSIAPMLKSFTATMWKTSRSYSRP